MYWMARPAYWRWLAAAAVVTVAAYMDLAGPATESYPFTASATEPGAPVDVEWKQIPVGILGAHGDLSGRVDRRLDAGTPLVAGMLAPAGRVPEDWWAVAAAIPAHAQIGSEVLVVMRDPDREVVGVVVEPSLPAGFGATSIGLLAVPPQHATAVAAALADQSAALLVRP